jgi:hypothetical protein
MEDYLGSLRTKHLSVWLSDKEWAEWVEYIKSIGVEPAWPAGRWPEEKLKKLGGCGVVYLKDPDGILIEVQENYTPDLY